MSLKESLKENTKFYSENSLVIACGFVLYEFSALGHIYGLK